MASPVALHRAVVVEVVARQVREERDVELDAGDAVLVEADATTLPCATACAPLPDELRAAARAARPRRASCSRAALSVRAQAVAERADDRRSAGRVRVSACAIHWLQDVLPLVPVTPTIHSRAARTRRRTSARDLAGVPAQVRHGDVRHPPCGTPAEPARLPQHVRRAARDRLADVSAPVAASRPDTRRTCRRAAPAGCRSRAA